MEVAGQNDADREDCNDSHVSEQITLKLQILNRVSAAAFQNQVVPAITSAAVKLEH